MLETEAGYCGEATVTDQFGAAPVEVYQRTEFYESINSKVVDPGCGKEKTGFLQSLFGEKKCNRCSQKKSNCTCKGKKKNKGVQSRPNLDTKNICDEKSPVGQSAGCGTSKEIQTTAIPTNFPIVRRGCGCQFYFCIDSKRKKIPVKNKKAVNRKNEKIKRNTSPKYFSNCVETGFNCREPKVTVICDGPESKAEESKGNILLKKSHSQRSLIPKNNIRTKSNVSMKTKRKPYRENTTEKIIPTPEFYSFNQRAQTENVNQERNKLTERKGLDNVKGTNSERFNNDDLSFFESIGFNLEKNEAIAQELRGPSKTKKEEANTEKDRLEHCFGENNGNPRILRNSPQPFNAVSDLFLVKVNSTICPSCEKDIDKKQTEANKLNNKSRNVSIMEETKQNDTDDEIILRDYRAYLKDGKKRKSTDKFPKSFVRNSLVPLRRERRQSQLEGRVSLILLKLDHIEGKIAELEKACGNKDNNITMGISCNKKNSKVSIKFNKENDQSKGTKQTYIISPSEEKFIREIKSKHWHEDIHINSPNELKVSKLKKKTKSEKEIVYHNSRELDAHRISSKPASNAGSIVKCKNPKVVIEYQKKKRSCKSPTYCDKWRRISEELKISHHDVTIRSKLINKK